MTPPRPPSPSRGLALVVLGLAAVVVVLVVTGIGQRAEPPSVQSSLEQAARDLAARAPESWGALALLGPDELSASPPAPLAIGAVAPVAPQGLIVGGRPRLRWNVTPITAWVGVRVLDAEGRERWMRRGQGGFLDYPPEEPELSRGAWTFEVRALDVASSPTLRAGFEVAAEPDVERFAAAAAAARAHAPKDLAWLLSAHAAVRLGFLLEAEAAAQQALRFNPESSTVLALLRHVHGRLGEREGW